MTLHQTGRVASKRGRSPYGSCWIAVPSGPEACERRPWSTLFGDRRGQVFLVRRNGLVEPSISRRPCRSSNSIFAGESNLGLQRGELPKQLGLILRGVRRRHRAFAASWKAPRRRTRDSARCSATAGLHPCRLPRPCHRPPQKQTTHFKDRSAEMIRLRSNGSTPRSMGISGLCVFGRLDST